MLIDCPACARSYHVTRDELGDFGRTVICPRCQTQWFVAGDLAETDLVAEAVSQRVAAEVEAPVHRPSLLRRLRPVAGALAGIAVLMALIGARNEVVRAAPRVARLYALLGLPVNVYGLEIADVTSTRVDRARLSIAGELRNIAPRRVAVPRLICEIQDASGADLVRWSEHVSARAVAVGQSLSFTTAPHDVPEGAAKILVHFES